MVALLLLRVTRVPRDRFEPRKIIVSFHPALKNLAAIVRKVVASWASTLELALGMVVSIQISFTKSSALFHVVLRNSNGGDWGRSAGNHLYLQ